MQKKHRKTGKEQYYTSRSLVKECLDFFFYVKGLDIGYTILEPSGGTGNFIDGLLSKGYKNIVSYDIEPKHPLVIKTEDFLKEDLSYLRDRGVIAIGNPPFGRGSSLAVPFFNKCAEVSETIAFIIPASWGKWSLQKKLDKRFHLTTEIPLRPDYVDDKGYPMDENGRLKTLFQIWDKKTYLRENPLDKIIDYGLIKKTTPEEADIAFTTHGYSCGRIEEDFPRVLNTTKIFLTVKDKSVIDALKDIDYSVFYTKVSYTYCICLPEIMYLLNKKMGFS